MERDVVIERCYECDQLSKSMVVFNNDEKGEEVPICKECLKKALEMLE